MTKAQVVRSTALDSSLELEVNEAENVSEQQLQCLGPVAAKDRQRHLVSDGDSSGLGPSFRLVAVCVPAKPSSGVFLVILSVTHYPVIDRFSPYVSQSWCLWLTTKDFDTHVGQSPRSRKCWNKTYLDI